MPDDDYEVVTTMPCGCDYCSKINAKMEKAKQIEELLAEAERTTTADHATVYLVKVLRLMNGIE